MSGAEPVEKSQKTEQIERVPNSIPHRNRFTADRLDSRLTITYLGFSD